MSHNPKAPKEKKSKQEISLQSIRILEGLKGKRFNNKTIKIPMYLLRKGNIAQNAIKKEGKTIVFSVFIQQA